MTAVASPIAVVTIGLPASGKTTAATALTNLQDINLDDCRQEISGDAGDQSVTGQALALQASKIADAIAARRSVVVSNTNLIPEHRAALVNQFRAAGFHVSFMFFDTPLDVCMARNAARDRVVPDHAMQRMAQALADFPPQACADALGVPLLTVGA